MMRIVWACLCSTKTPMIVGTAFLLSSQVFAQNAPRTRSYSKPVQTTSSPPAISEKQISYPDYILREELDFELTPVSEGKFNLNITTRTKGFFFVKVYDVIGNLLYEKKVRVRGNYQQEIDMSEHTTNFFIIEIGNEEFNRTKSIVAT